MRIGGIQRFSLIDYPGKISAIVFTQGCNFSCPYCHNTGLVIADLFTTPVPVEEVLSFLQRRKGLIEGVVITGGEPLLQPGLKNFILEIKKMGYAVKLDTNGSYPQRLEELLSEGCLDYIAMDYKAPLEKYVFVAGAGADADSIRGSLTAITRCGLPYEVRTTLFQGITQEDAVKMMGELKTSGVENYYLQMPLDRNGGFAGHRLASATDLRLLSEKLRDDFKRYGIRNIGANHQKEFMLNARRNVC